MTRQYIVFFKNSQFKIFKPLGDFGHVFLVSKDNNGIWVGIDPCFNGIAISSVTNKEIDEFKTCYTYVELTNYNGYSHQLGIPMLKSCVGLAKAALGISNPLIWTPKQLYNHLRKISCQ